MKTYLECIPCFFKQALEAAKVCGADVSVHKKIVDDVARMLPDFSLDFSPPEMGRMIHAIVKKHTKKEDPYKEIKQKSNALALGVFDVLKQKVEKSDDKLLTAVELAIAGNIIDYGVKNSLDVDSEIEKILRDEHIAIKHEDGRFFRYDLFREVLDKSNSILYLGDNAGETVFDRFLLEEIKARGKNIIYAVKEKPIINDALVEDAHVSGIDKFAKVISSGSDAPGTVLSICSKEFIALFEKSDMVISKGQGNFEALSFVKRTVFFLFMAKCPVVVRHVGCNLRDILLMCNSD